MSVSIYLTPNLPELTEILAANLHRQTQKDAFVSPKILTPNRNLSRYIELYLARRKGICANLDFSYLDSFITDYCRDKFAEGTEEFSLLGETEELLLLYSLLGTPEAQVLQNYGKKKENKKTEEEETLALYRLDLATRLHGLFHAYERHEPAMVEAWLSGNAKKASGSAQKANPEIYEAERSLYLAFHKACLEQDKPRRFSLLQKILKEKVHKNNSSSQKHLPDSLHLFGFSQLSCLHMEFISVLSKKHDIFYYLTHPPNLSCKSKAAQPDSQGLFFLGQAPEFVEQKPASPAWPVEAFGAAHKMLGLFGRIHPKANWYWKPAAKGSSKKSNKEKDGESLLLLLKQDLQQNANLATKAPKVRGPIAFPEDGPAIQFVAAPGKRREIEAIYQSILRHLDNDPSLSLNEIAILLPDVASYRSAIASVFGSHAGEKGHFLPYNLTDFRSEEESLYLSAQKALFAILLGEEPDFDELLSLFQNPLFLAAWQASPGHSDFWNHWADSLSVFGTEQSLNPVRNWKAAKERLLLGLITDPGPSNEKDSLVLDMSAFPVQGGDAEEALGILLSILANWEQTRQELRKEFNKPKARPNYENILNTIFIFLKRNIEIPEALSETHKYVYRGEQKIEEECFLALEELKKALPLIAGAPPTPRLLFELIRRNLKNMQGSQGRYLSTGITISALHPMRPIPFRYIYVAGLNASDFPGREDNSSLNLLAKKETEKQLSSYLSLPERNNLLFMEMFFAAHDGFYLSYDAHDLQKDEWKPPSPAFSAFRDYANAFFGSLQKKDVDSDLSNEPTFSEIGPPLFLFDANYERKAQGEPVSHFLYNYQNKAANKNTPNPPAAWEALFSALPEKKLEAKRSFLSVDLHKLSFFLANPPDAVLRELYGLYDPEVQEKKTEPLLQTYLRNNIFKKICSELVFRAANSSGSDFPTKLLGFLEDHTNPIEKDDSRPQSTGEQIAKEIYENFSIKGEAQTRSLGGLDFASIWDFCKTYLFQLAETLQANGGTTSQKNSNSTENRTKADSQKNTSPPDSHSRIFYPSLRLVQKESISEASSSDMLSAPEIEIPGKNGTEKRQIQLQGEISWLVAGPASLEIHVFFASSINTQEALSSLLSLFAFLLSPPEPLRSESQKETNGKDSKKVDLKLYCYTKDSKPKIIPLCATQREVRNYLQNLLSVYLENREGMRKPEWLYPDLLSKAAEKGAITLSNNPSDKPPNKEQYNNNLPNPEKAFQEDLFNFYASSESSFARMTLTEQLFEPHFSKEAFNIYKKSFILNIRKTGSKEIEEVSLIELIPKK